MICRGEVNPVALRKTIEKENEFDKSVEHLLFFDNFFLKQISYHNIPNADLCINK